MLDPRHRVDRPIDVSEEVQSFAMKPDENEGTINALMAKLSTSFQLNQRLGFRTLGDCPDRLEDDLSFVSMRLRKSSRE